MAPGSTACCKAPAESTIWGQNFGADLYEREVAYLVDQEWACSAEDVLWRRPSSACI